MDKTKETVIVPRRDYDRLLRNTEITRMFDEMKRTSGKSNNCIYTYIGAHFGVSISAVINAVRICKEGGTITLTRE